MSDRKDDLSAAQELANAARRFLNEVMIPAQGSLALLCDELGTEPGKGIPLTIAVGVGDSAQEILFKATSHGKIIGSGDFH